MNLTDTLGFIILEELQNSNRLDFTDSESNLYRIEDYSDLYSVFIITYGDGLEGRRKLSEVMEDIERVKREN